MNLLSVSDGEFEARDIQPFALASKCMIFIHYIKSHNVRQGILVSEIPFHISVQKP